jgi:hypothetical protein
MLIPQQRQAFFVGRHFKMTFQLIKMVRQFALTAKAFIMTFTIFTFCSCRSHTDYKQIKDKSIDSSDTLITATATMWQGQYEYLGIDIYINRTDSLFCKKYISNTIIKK